MIRRLRTLGEKHKCTSFADLAAKMDRDSGVLGEFLDHFTINVTELYRNPELFQHFIKIPCCPNSARTASVAPSKPGVRDIDEAQHRV